MCADFALFCSRSLYATFEKEVHVKGIPAYRFVPPKEVFANITVNPANAGFCVPAGNCLGSGLLNVSVCKQGRSLRIMTTGIAVLHMMEECTVFHLVSVSLSHT